MKKIMLSLLLVLSLAAQAATFLPQDTLVVTRPNKVTIISSDSTQYIRVEGKDGNPTFNYESDIQLVDSNYVSTSGISNDWNFSFGPFSSKQEYKTRYPYVDVCSRIFVGFCSAPGLPSGADLHPFSSWELWWLIADSEIYPWNRHHSFSIGFGVDWRNYRIKGDQRFDKLDDGQVVLTSYPEGASPKFSRLKVFSLTVPIRYHFSSKHFGFSLGPVVNFNTYSSLKTKWKMDGAEQKEISKDAHVKPVTVDFLFTVRGLGASFYMKYSPWNLIKDGYGLKFKTLSFGIYI